MLPNPGMSFSPFAILTAEELNDLVENIEALSTGSGLGTDSVGPEQWTNDVAFRAYCSASISMPNGAFTTVPTNTVEYDFSGIFDTTTKSVVPTIPGIYHFDARFAPSSTSVTRVVPTLMKNSVGYARGNDFTVNGSTILVNGASVSADIELAVGDTVDFRAYVSPSTGIDIAPSQTYFSGHLVSPR